MESFEHMKLNIAKGSLWLCYSLINSKLSNYLIPPHLEIAKVSPIEGIKAQEMLLFNAYHIHSSPWMDGARLDIQTFARDKNTGTAHLVVLDVLTNTKNWDPINGLNSANCEVTFKKTPGIDIQFRGKENIFCVKGTPDRRKNIDHTFCVEANKKCYFGRFKRGYSMNFEEKNIMNPVTELKNLEIENTCWTDITGNLICAFRHNTEMQFDIQMNPWIEANKILSW